MNAERDIILLMDALGKPDNRQVVTVGDSAWRALGMIASVLDWRTHTINAVTTNLNDMDVAESPLGRAIRHAGASDYRYVIFVHDANPALLASPAHRAKLEHIALYAPVIISMTEVPESFPGWDIVDLRADVA